MEPDSDHTKQGILYATGAFTIWGLNPLYFKMVAETSASEIIVQRIVWTAVMLPVVILLAKRMHLLRQVVRSPKLLAGLALTGSLIAVNWMVFTWAVTHDQVLATSMGYFINPLFNVLLGIVFLRERLRSGQWLAVGIASVGVAYMIVQNGNVPWIALVLPVSFGLYGFIRKLLPVDPMSGLLMETVILLPFALGYLFWMEGSTGTVTFGDNWNLKALLVVSGPMTIIPLCLFAAGTKRIPLSTIGILQYLAPSLSFLLAVFVFGEAFQTVQLVSFGLIWLSLAVFTGEGLYTSRNSAIAAPSEA